MPLPVRAAILAFACLTALVALGVRREKAIGVALGGASPPTFNSGAWRILIN